MTKKANHKRIALIGAYGYTGSILTECLAEEGIEFTTVGRNPEKLDQNGLVKDLQKEEDRKYLLDNFDIFLNSAGPFGIESKQFIEELSLRSEKVYLDITGELDLVRSIKESCGGSRSLIVQGVAFESLVADLGARIYQNENAPITALHTYYHFSESRPSPGTKITMKLSNLKDTYFLRDGDFEKVNDEREELELRNEIKVAVPYPLPEVAYWSWENDVKDAGSYLLLNKTAAIFVGAKGNKSELVESTYEKLKTRKGKGPNLKERASQTTALYLKFNNNPTQVVLLEAEDMYLITAKAMVFALYKVMDNQDFSGVKPPSSLFKNEEKEILDLLGITYSLTSIE
ncbi:MAG: hypothetical protein MK078_03205 [Crocinitomicaceae bacterium]|nr:hypothetical protein [Crocinitomicaceae bacterium]